MVAVQWADTPEAAVPPDAPIIVEAVLANLTSPSLAEPHWTETRVTFDNFGVQIYALATIALPTDVPTVRASRPPLHPPPERWCMDRDCLREADEV